MKLFTVLNNMKSPYRDFKFEFGCRYTRTDFDPEKTGASSNGFWALGINGLGRAFRQPLAIYEVQTSGRCVGKRKSNRWYESIELVRRVSYEEILEIAVGRNRETLFPFNPFEVEREKKSPSDMELKILDKWINIKTNAQNAMEGTDAYFPVGASTILHGIFHGLFLIGGIDALVAGIASARECLWAYIGSLFHGPDYPFQPAVDLWYNGLVASCFGGVWRLHGKDMEIVYERAAKQAPRKYQAHQH